MPDGSKAYLATTDEDRCLYRQAEEALKNRRNAYPIVAISPGYNTDQVLGYNYRYWHEMFNARQLLCLSMLADRIREIPNKTSRDLFVCLLSGTLEFNNMFASYKGEGTGAVRHMFAHHILKPERVPLEANLWGTPRSSGSFSTMFDGRIRRALTYAENPFEIGVAKRAGKRVSHKVFGISEKVGFQIADNYAEFCSGVPVYLSCGDSQATDIADRSVDAVISDPPFFDNVHYSQLADFFHVWQRHILGANGLMEQASTRSGGEVQNEDVAVFTSRLTGVWREAHRVLKDDGILAFTYHHSRPEGWRSLLVAVVEAGFGISAAHPIKSEMSVAMPKQQAKEPIDLDIILVCRKRPQLETQPWTVESWSLATASAIAQIERLRQRGRKLSRNDVRLVVVAQVVRRLSLAEPVDLAVRLLQEAQGEIDTLVHQLHSGAHRMPTAIAAGV